MYDLAGEDLIICMTWLGGFNYMYDLAGGFNYMYDLAGGI